MSELSSRINYSIAAELELGVPRLKKHVFFDQELRGRGDVTFRCKDLSWR